MGRMVYLPTLIPSNQPLVVGKYAIVPWILWVPANSRQPTQCQPPLRNKMDIRVHEWNIEESWWFLTYLKLGGSTLKFPQSKHRGYYNL